jgi:hypothetical protein
MKGKKQVFASISEGIVARRMVALAALICAIFVFGVGAQAQSKPAKPGTVFVKGALGGFILGYDIDQNGTEGLLSESLNATGGNFDVATETFDQTTGKIVKIVREQMKTKNDFVTLGIYGNSVGLFELEKVKGLFVQQRLYSTMNPLSGNKVTGMWKPSLTRKQGILGLAPSQGSPNTVVLVQEGTEDAEIFSSNVADNTFGPVIPLTGGFFGFGTPPAPGLDPVTNQVLVAGGTGAFDTHPTLAEVDLTTQNVTQFEGLGFGFVNGIAVDSADGIAVTTTEDDFSIEYYNLATLTGFEVTLKNATDQSQSGGYVAFDPINKLFLVGQEFSSVAPSGSSILVYDTKGNFVEAINGLSLPASPVNIAINPSKRLGFVLVTPALTELQSFTY